MNLYNTNMKRELDHLARFVDLTADHAKSIGFPRQFLFEPKPKEPTKYQYDFDAATSCRLIGSDRMSKQSRFSASTIRPYDKCDDLPAQDWLGSSTRQVWSNLMGHSS